VRHYSTVCKMKPCSRRWMTILWFPIKIGSWSFRQYSEQAVSWMSRESGFQSRQVEWFFSFLQQSVQEPAGRGLYCITVWFLPVIPLLLVTSFVFVYLCAVELWPNRLHILKHWNRRTWRFCFVMSHTTNWCWCSWDSLTAVTWRLWRRRCDRIKSRMTLQILVSSR
jgi:hypothetical protein